MKVLVVSPHTDDETLGAGGIILKYANTGNEVYWLNVTNAKEEYGYTKEEEWRGKEQVEKVANLYGVKEYIDLNLEPAGLDKYRTSELVRLFAEIVKKIEPQVVIIPYKNDVHTDHRIVFETMYSCTKAFRYPSIRKVLCMEIISETDYAVADEGFVPNYYVDISDYIDKKIDIMKVYESEIGNSPFPRNEEAIRGLAKYRAAACNAHYAEAFRLLKEIE